MSFSKTPRPIPKFFVDDDSTFSTKKERLRKSPRTTLKAASRAVPAKTAPPLSRVYPRRWADQRPHFISFKAHSESFLAGLESRASPRFDESASESYLEQAFVIEERIGEGSFGEVFRVRSRQDGCLYAVKRALGKFRSEADRAAKLGEVQKHEGLPRHPNLVHFLRAWEERGRLYIQTELCRSSLASAAAHCHSFPEPLIWDYLVDLLLAVQHLHENNLLHLDIKPENIFISRDGLCKLGDFGLVFDLQKQALSSAQEGDAKYLSPELLHEKPGKAADIFSLGISILEIAVDLDLPIHGESWQDLRRHLLPWNLLKKLSPGLQELIKVMLEPNPAKRPSAAALLRRPEIQGALHRRRLFQRWCQLRSMVCAFFLWIYCFLRFLYLLVLGPLTGRLLPASESREAGRRSEFGLSESPVGQRGFEEHTPNSGARLAMPLNFESDYSDEDEGLGDVSSIRGDSGAVSSEAHEETDSDELASPPLDRPRIPRRPFNSTPAQTRKRSRRDPAAFSLHLSPAGDSPALKRLLSRTQPPLREEHEPPAFRVEEMSCSGDGFLSPAPPRRRPAAPARVSPRNLRLAFDHHGSSSEDET